ncbi:MAG: hypothetical protein Q4B69_02990 [Slackia sp.]|nr:hypothetical protein [Slackia sp.]
MEESPACVKEEILALMDDVRLRRLRAAADSGLLLYDDLDDYELPDGYGKQDVWKLLTAIRKQAAVFMPDDPYRKADCWFVTTTALSYDSKLIEIRCKSGYPLERDIDMLKGSPFLTKSIERTISRALEAEGADVSDGRIHDIFAARRTPRTPLDKVIGNYIEISHSADELAAREITHGLIETIYYRLVEGVDVDAIPRRAKVCPLDERILPPDSAACIDAVCRLARLEEGGEHRFGPVQRIINITWYFWNFDVFPCLNSLVGVLLRNVIAIKWNLPVLSWVPVGYYPFGRLNTPFMKSVFESWSVDCGFGFDFTSYFYVYTRFYLEEIDKLERTTDELKLLNDRIAALFDFPMNDRQKSIISSLCREPDAALRIAPHQRTFGVAYATARADFLDLERRGFLVREHEGKAFVFKACAALHERVTSLGEAAVGEY